MQTNGLLISLIGFLVGALAMAGTLRDNFDDGNLEGWTPLAWLNGKNGIHKVENGEVILKSVGNGSGITIGQTSWKNYMASVRCKLVHHQPTPGWNEAAGIALRIQPIQRNAQELPPPFVDAHAFHFGTVGINPKSTHAFTCMRGNRAMHHLQSKPFEWKLNKWYQLKVEAKENRFKFYLDDELMIDYKDKTHPTGMIGFGSAVHTTTAHFDDFVATGDDIPDLNLSVSPQSKLAVIWAEEKRF